MKTADAVLIDAVVPLTEAQVRLYVKRVVARWVSMGRVSRSEAAGLLWGARRVEREAGR